MQKTVFSLLFSLVFFSSRAQSAFHADSLHHDSLLRKAATGSISTEEKSDLILTTFRIQNEGFRLDESSHDYAGAYEKTSLGLKTWIAFKDSANEANIRKYNGYLLGRLGKFEEGKNELRKAIFLYDCLKMDFGRAVSEFDLARVYHFEGKNDSAIYFAQRSLDYWNQHGENSFRVVTINNFLIDLYTNTGDLPRANNLIEANSKLIRKENLHWQPLLDFYVVSANYYQKSAQPKNAARNRKRAAKIRIKVMREEGRRALSQYE